MNGKFLAIAALPLLLAVTGFSQTAKAPRPSPELKKLDYFVGAGKQRGRQSPVQWAQAVVLPRVITMNGRKETSS